ncbi:hypothetical protein GCM10025770_35630 [Viridibacterium curvum]|uniref:Solute-binding protein family 3/N-terminal domain-containing protein n=1 Tax=Viridibacterium curvum TaxID=1101404 RepID=A0ABP9R4E2_9RHOO
MPRFLLLAAASTAMADESAPVQVVFDLRPPLVFREGDLLGGSIGGIAMKSLHAAGIRFSLQEVPVRRQLNMVEDNRQVVCAVGRIKTAERERRGWFSHALGQSRGYVALIRQGEPMPQPPSLSLWANDPKLGWGVQAGLHYSDQIDRLRTSARAQISTFNANHQHFADLLVAQRIDFVILQADEAAEILLRNAAAAKALRIVELTDVGTVEQRHFYCSRRLPEAQRRALDEAIIKVLEPAKPAPAARTPQRKP